MSGVHGRAAPSSLREGLVQSAAGLDHLAVDADAPAARADLVGGESNVLTPPHAGVGDEKDLQLPPPDLSEIGGCLGESMGGLDGRDLVLGDCVIGGLRRHVLAEPAHTTEEVLADEDVALLQPGVDEGREASAEMLGDRGGGCLAEDALEVGPGELPALDVTDHGKDVQVAVADLLVAVAL